MKNKYGLVAACRHCKVEFLTKPRFLEYCSTKCKNPLNRGEYDPWNKGIKLTEEQKLKQNTSGLSKGHGWNKGKSNEAQRIKWKENNPNKDGRLNNLRPRKIVTDKFKIYKSEVRKATYRTLKQLKEEGHYIPKFGKYKNDWQVDHIISILQGFELKIPAHLLGTKKNIQFLKGEDNRAKWCTKQPSSVILYITGNKYGLQ